MAFKVFCDKVIVDILNYLETKGYDKVKLNKIIDNTIFFEYTNPENETIEVIYKGIKIKEVLDSSLNNVCGFQLPLLIEYNNKIVNATNLIGIDSKNKKKFRKNILIHELMHLLSQKEMIIDNKYYICTGILKEEFKLIDKDVICNSNLEYIQRINEGMTQYLAKFLEKEIYNKHNFTHDYSVYSDLITIFNVFLFNTTDIDKILDIYMNNKIEEFFSIIKSELGISEKFLKKNILPKSYYDVSKIYLNLLIIKYLRVIINKKKKNNKNLEGIKEKILTNISKEKYPYVIWYINYKFR